ncbi:MAG: Gfo/Idh/MocA family oxidoreductase [bacterium]
MKIRVGQVGVGHLGVHHCSVLTEIADAELVGVFDIDFEKSRRVARAHGVRAFSELPELLAQVHALIVAVPTRHHFEIAEAALSSKVHVFVEKPITATVAEADELIRLAEKEQLILQVGHIERFNPAWQALASERLNPMFIEAHRLASFDPRGTDVTVVLDLMIHDLDLVLSIVPSPIKRIDASGVSVVSSEIDIANARIQFENGCVANVTASRISQKKMRKMWLFQKDAYISVDFFRRFSEVFRLVKGSTTTKNGQVRSLEALMNKNHIIHERLVTDAQDPLKTELEAFLESITSGEEPLVDGVTGQKVLELATEIMGIIEEQTSMVA